MEAVDVWAAGAGRQGNANQEGITGMRNLGSRELTYKLAFLACATEVPPPKALFLSTAQSQTINRSQAHGSCWSCLLEDLSSGRWSCWLIQVTEQALLEDPPSSQK